MLFESVSNSFFSIAELMVAEVPMQNFQTKKIIDVKVWGGGCSPAEMLRNGTFLAC